MRKRSSSSRSTPPGGRRHEEAVHAGAHPREGRHHSTETSSVRCLSPTANRFKHRDIQRLHMGAVTVPTNYTAITLVWFHVARLEITRSVRLPSPNLLFNCNIIE
eukprot:1462788-Amphidinium_carterae.1